MLAVLNHQGYVILKPETPDELSALEAATTIDKAYTQSSGLVVLLRPERTDQTPAHKPVEEVK